MKKIITMITMFTLLLSTFTASFADTTYSKDEDLKSISKILKIDQKKITNSDLLTLDGKTYQVILYSDNSILTYSDVNDYSYSYFENGIQNLVTSDMGTFTNINGVGIKDKDNSYETLLIPEFMPIVPYSDSYTLDYQTKYHYFQYYNLITNVSRYTRLTVGRGLMTWDRESYARSTAATNPTQAFENKARNFYDYIINTITLKDPNFFNDALNLSYQFFPTFTVATRTDITEMAAEYTENGYKLQTASLATAFASGVVDAYGQGVLQAATAFAQAGFSLASWGAVVANYHNIENAYDMFKTVN